VARESCILREGLSIETLCTRDIAAPRLRHLLIGTAYYSDGRSFVSLPRNGVIGDWESGPKAILREPDFSGPGRMSVGRWSHGCFH
jgi:hypothetical protein